MLTVQEAPLAHFEPRKPRAFADVPRSYERQQARVGRRVRFEATQSAQHVEDTGTPDWNIDRCRLAARNVNEKWNVCHLLENEAPMGVDTARTQGLPVIGKQHEGHAISPFQ